MDGKIYLKKIIFFGEHSPLNNKVIEILKKHYSVNCENFTVSDSTVSGTHRSVVKYVTEYDIKDCFIVIAWPSPYRIELREDTDDTTNNSYHFFDENYFTFVKDRHFTKSKAKYNKLHMFNSIIFDKHLIHGKWAVTAYGLIEFLKSFDIKFIMYNSILPIEFDQFNKNTLKNINRHYYINAIDKNDTMHKIANKDINAWTNKLIEYMDCIIK